MQVSFQLHLLDKRWFLHWNLCMQYVQFSKNIQASPGILNTASHVTSSQLPSDVHNHMTPVLRYTRPSTTNSCPTQIATRTFSSWLSSSLHTGTTLWPPLWARSRALGVLGRTDSVGGGHPGEERGRGSEVGRGSIQLSTGEFCTQLTKAYVVETSCNQLLLTAWFCYVYAHKDLFASCHNLAMSFYNIIEYRGGMRCSACDVYDRPVQRGDTGKNLGACMYVCTVCSRLGNYSLCYRWCMHVRMCSVPCPSLSASQQLHAGSSFISLLNSFNSLAIQ